jgi:hypothetical protein
MVPLTGRGNSIYSVFNGAVTASEICVCTQIAHYWYYDDSLLEIRVRLPDTKEEVESSDSYINRCCALLCIRTAVSKSLFQISSPSIRTRKFSFATNASNSKGSLSSSGSESNNSHTNSVNNSANNLPSISTGAQRNNSAHAVRADWHASDRDEEKRKCSDFANPNTTKESTSARTPLSRKSTDILMDMEAFEEEMKMFRDVPDQHSNVAVNEERTSDYTNLSNSLVTFDLRDPERMRGSHSQSPQSFLTSRASDSSNTYISESSASSASSHSSVSVLSSLMSESDKQGKLGVLAYGLGIVSGTTAAVPGGLSPRDKFLQRPAIKLTRRNTLPVRLDVPAPEVALGGQDAVHRDTSDKRRLSTSFKSLQHVHSMPRWIGGG